MTENLRAVQLGKIKMKIGSRIRLKRPSRRVNWRKGELK
jgi:hypothetical protein